MSNKLIDILNLANEPNILDSKQVKKEHSEMIELLISIWESGEIKIKGDDIIYEVPSDTWQKLEDYLNLINK